MGLGPATIQHKDLQDKGPRRPHKHKDPVLGLGTRVWDLHVYVVFGPLTISGTLTRGTAVVI